MKIVLDTHAHTLVSGHAYNTVREMARMAKEKGLEALALTDHAPAMPGTCHEFYFKNLEVLPRQMEGVKMFFGSELNLLDEKGTVDLAQSTLEDLDIAIASIHPPCFKAEITMENVMGAYFHAMENPRIHIIGHPDDGRFPVDYEALVLKAKETGTLLELNNSSLRPSGFRMNAYGNDLEMLTYCKKYGVPITLGSDAHVDVDIAEYEVAMKLLAECEFPEELIINTSVDKLEKILDI